MAEQAREWKIAVEQAENVAKLVGKLPAGITRSIGQSEAAGVDWRELLRRAWSETIPSDYSWMPPNRRHVWAGLYLPGVTLRARARSPSPSIARDPSVRVS
jgi:predicted metal-dependent peptidase